MHTRIEIFKIDQTIGDFVALTTAGTALRDVHVEIEVVEALGEETMETDLEVRNTPRDGCHTDNEPRR